MDDLVPEMQANVRVIATQEVEIAGLRKDIEQSRANLQAERTRVQKLRESLASENGDYTFGGIHYSRDQVKDDLAHRFDFLKEAEVVQAGKERLLQNRERSLAAAMQTLDHMKSQKTLLEGQIASLEAQNQLIQSAAVGSNLSVDNTKLAQTERLISDVKKQLDIAERRAGPRDTLRPADPGGHREREGPALAGRRAPGRPPRRSCDQARRRDGGCRVGQAVNEATGRRPAARSSPAPSGEERRPGRPGGSGTSGSGIRFTSAPSADVRLIRYTGRPVARALRE